MIDLPAWRDRIRDQVPDLAEVGLMGDLTQALAVSRPHRLPAAYLYETRYSAGDNAGDNFVRQVVNVEFVCLLALDQRNRLRANGQEELTTLRAAILGAILGWSPDAGQYDEAVYNGGALERIEDGVLWWRDAYITSIILEAK